MPCLIGYARVSTVGQTFESQVATLKKIGCNPVFKEKISGSKINRPQLNRMLSSLHAGDTVVVTRIDRMARSTFDLFAIISLLSQKQVIFRSLAEPWADTATSTGRLMLAVLGGLADVERDLIRNRTAEGRARAIKKGVKMGRPRCVSETQRIKMTQQRANGQTLQRIASHHGVAASTVMRVLRQEQQKREVVL